LNSSERITLYAAHQKQAKREEAQENNTTPNLTLITPVQPSFKSYEQPNLTQKTFIIYMTD